jgi:hypothetical protein
MVAEADTAPPAAAPPDPASGDSPDRGAGPGTPPATAFWAGSRDPRPAPPTGQPASDPNWYGPSPAAGDGG